MVIFKLKQHTEWIVSTHKIQILDCCFFVKHCYIIPSQEEMSQVLDAMFEKFCTEGEHIIDQDDDGDNFYVLER